MRVQYLSFTGIEKKSVSIIYTEKGEILNSLNGIDKTMELINTMILCESG